LSGPARAGEVIAVARDDRHRFSKRRVDAVLLIAGLGVEGDAHLGETVQHRSRVAVDPDQPNLRQVHLIHLELLDELAGKGFAVGPAELGENVTTRGIDLLALPRGALLRLGEEAIIEVTGLRNPCGQIDDFQPGLLKAVLDKGPAGEIIRKSGVMAIVQRGGEVRPGDTIRVELPPQPHVPLDRV
jgi:MOSC domain-containing protein YiiM